MKMQTTKPLLIGVLALTIQTADAGSVAGTGGATEVTQLAVHSQHLLSYVEQVQQTLHQFNAYTLLFLGLKKLVPSELLDGQVFKLWKENGMTQTFRDLYRIVNNGQRIAYTLQSMESDLQRLNPGYGNYAKFDFQKAYRDWSDSTRNTTISALKVGKAQAEDFATEADMIKELTKRS